MAEHIGPVTGMYVGPAGSTPPQPSWKNGQQSGKLWEFYEGGSPADAPPTEWRELVLPRQHRGHQDDLIFDVHAVRCPGCDELVRAARRDAGACESCGSISDLMHGHSFGSDVAFPSCAACGWVGQP